MMRPLDPRGRRRLLLTICVLALQGAMFCFSGGTVDAMLYRPSQGRFKDGFLCHHHGQFYLFSMCSLSGSDDFRHVWLATSADGVHWKDVGPVIKDAPFNIWAMSIHRVGDTFILNHGSFSRPGVQNVIRFWESRDLVHWSYLGPQSDLYPDPRWYHADSRLDCMSVVTVPEADRTHYYGFATGPGGFCESADGRSWTGLPQPRVEWDSVTPPPTPPDEGGFEVGGCHAMQGKYYLVGGWFNGKTEIGRLTLGSEAAFLCEDEIGPGCAAPAGIAPHGTHTFRLLVRQNMFELYLDDRFVQTFNTTHQPDRPGRTPRRLGFVTENGIGVFENLRAWSMNLEP